MATGSNALDAVTAVSTAIAAIGTAIAAGLAASSAFSSRASAKAAEEAVAESRRARLAQLTPRLVLEADFGGYRFEWPCADSREGFPFYGGFRGEELIAPTFSLTNFGQMPALEVQVVLELEDRSDKMSLPSEVRALGIKVLRPRSNPALRFESGSFIAMLTKTIATYPNIAPGQTRKVAIDMFMMSQLFLRGMQTDSPSTEVILTITVNCHTIEGDKCPITRFRFKVTPWRHETTPTLVVLATVEEVPIYSDLVNVYSEESDATA